MTSDDVYLSAEAWLSLTEKHRQTARHWTVPSRQRRASRQKHPVYDFLFTYYPFSMGRLEQWHPGMGIALEVTENLPATLCGKHYKVSKNIVKLDPKTLSLKEIQRLKWIHNLLVLTQSRAGNYGCHGMHEWAMVYSGADIRHAESAPLRLSQRETDEIVESLPITCSHFDAYRFFSPAALDLNKLRPTLRSREQNEQPACLHTNMDLYKWASKCMPWISSELLWETFLLAVRARELDMRASPYDLRQYDYSPITIENSAGRAEYEKLQKAVSRRARSIRQKLIHQLSNITALTSQTTDQ